MKQRKDGLYCKQITIEVDGQKKRLSFYGKGTAEINQKILAYRTKALKGKQFKDVADEWREEHFKTVKYYTEAAYITVLNDILPELGQMYINEMTAPVLQRYINKRASSKPAKSTLMLRLTVLKLIFRYAIVKGYANTNPTEYCSVPKGLSRKKRNAPSQAIIKKVKENTDKPFGLFPYFLLYTGMRKAEALAVTWQDIDFERKIIAVNKQVIFEPTIVVNSTKSDAGTREVILIDCLALKLKAIARDSGYVFNRKEKPLTRVTYEKSWTAYLEAIGEEFTAHQLRHAYITILYEAGIDEKLAQYLAGHSSITTTRNIYTEIRLKKMREAADALNKFNP